MELIITALLVAFQGFGVLSTVYMIGKPRGPITAGAAVFSILMGALMIAGILYLAAH